MRRSRLLLTLFVAVVTVVVVVAIFLKLRKPLPTKFNWKAQVITLAGDGAPVFRDVPEARRAGFSDPFGIAVGADGTIYISDAGDSNRLRKITPEGALLTVAGDKEGFADGIPASFNTPSGIAVDSEDNVYIADTSNNRIRKVTPEGAVSTVAGNGTAGFLDGSAAVAQFDGPIGVAVDSQNNIYVADTYNDRIRKISSDGQVITVAGAGQPGYADGEASKAHFDTPCGIVVAHDGSLIISDTGNDRLRKLTTAGQVSTLPVAFVDDPNRNWLRTPIGLAITHDGFLYVTEQDRGTVVQITPDGKACRIAGNGFGYADGFGDDARFNHPTGIAINPNNGDLIIADSGNYMVRRLLPGDQLISTQTSNESVPRLTPDTLDQKNLLWPLDPQDKPHEVVATMGEVRGSFDSTESRDHLHSGLDVSGAFGDIVRVVRFEKVTTPLPNWGFGELSEGLRIGVISYIHMQVGRDKDGNALKDVRFIPVLDSAGKIARIRIRRGASFQPGDALGTVNRMYHIHLIVGPSGGEVNPLLFAPFGFKDTIAPTIEKDGIQLFDETGKRLTEMEEQRLVVRGRARIVVDAFDRTDMNGERRRLGVYSVGYQLLASGAPAPGFSSPRVTILFNRLPADDSATKLAYAEESGITVYGSKSTRFLYDITNTIRDGHARAGWWNSSDLPKGDYLLRIVAADFSGNQTQNEIPIRIK